MTEPTPTPRAGHYGPYLPGAEHDQARVTEIQLMHGPCDPLQCNAALLLADRDAALARVAELEAAWSAALTEIEDVAGELGWCDEGDLSELHATIRAARTIAPAVPGGTRD